MRKRIFVILLLIGLLLGGCGGGGDTTATMNDDNYEAEYDTEDESSDIGAEYLDEDNMSGEAETKEDENEAELVEAKGIIAMVRQTGAMQIISVDPSSSEQQIVNEFHPDNSLFVLPKGKWIYSRSSSWISDDFEKIAVTKAIGSDEWHAGWIDNANNFFDVTEAIGAVKEVDFANPQPAQQEAVGFKDGLFVFRESGQYYYVPVDNPVANNITTEESEWERTQINMVQKTDTFYITDKVDENHYIADCYGDKGVIYSTIVNTDNNECSPYIPDSERLNWSGVLSPDNNRVAFLSLPKNSIEAGAELYITSIHEGDPISVPIIPCENSLLDASNLTYFDLFYSEAQYELYLLDWR